VHGWPHCDERVVVTAPRRVVVLLSVVVVLSAAVPELLVVLLAAGACDVVLLAGVVPLAVLLSAVVPELLVVPVLLATAIGAVVATAEVVVAVDASWEPKATQPPIVATIAAEAIVDFRRAASNWDRDLSVRVIVLFSRRHCLHLSHNHLVAANGVSIQRRYEEIIGN
jgi:hypothetical protein